MVYDPRQQKMAYLVEFCLKEDAPKLWADFMKDTMATTVDTSRDSNDAGLPRISQSLLYREKKDREKASKSKHPQMMNRTKEAKEEEEEERRRRELRHKEEGDRRKQERRTKRGANFAQEAEDLRGDEDEISVGAEQKGGGADDIPLEGVGEGVVSRGGSGSSYYFDWQGFAPASSFTLEEEIAASQSRYSNFFVGFDDTPMVSPSNEAKEEEPIENAIEYSSEEKESVEVEKEKGLEEQEELQPIREEKEKKREPIKDTKARPRPALKPAPSPPQPQQHAPPAVIKTSELAGLINLTGGGIPMPLLQVGVQAHLIDMVGYAVSPPLLPISCYLLI